MILGLPQEQILFLGLMIIVIFLFITEYLTVDIIAMLTILALAITGLLPAKDAFSGFSSEPAIIVAAVFVLSAGLATTGVTDIIGDWISRLSGKSETRALIVIMSAVAVMSAFTHHLMVTAMLLPIIMKICKNEKDLHASRLLIPMATAASLGTTLTLIGAPAFLLANNIIKRSGGEPLSLFSVGQVGGPLVLAGIIFCILMRWVLPKKSGIDETENQFKLTDITTEMIILENSSWIGKTFKELSEATKNNFTIINWTNKNLLNKHPTPETLIESEDTLIVRTTSDELVSHDGRNGLVLKALQKFNSGKEGARHLVGEEKHILKAVIAPKSEFVGRRLSHIHFQKRFEVAVVAIWRQSAWISTGIDETVLQSGDMLVLWGQEDKLEGLQLNRGFLMFLPFYGSSIKRNKSIPATLIMLGSIAIAAFGLLPAYIAFVSGALMMVLTKCVDLKQAYASIETKIYVMIAGVIPLGIAMEKTGVDQLIADLLLKHMGGWTPLLMLLAFFWISSLITQILSDAATTVLLAPIAVAFAKAASISPTGAVICVTIGAVASFLTPIGHHGNLLILSPGGYRFADFLKIGLPLTLILSLITCYMSLQIWTVG